MMHRLTADESTWAWWCLLLSLDKHVPFGGTSKTPGGRSNTGSPDLYLKHVATNYTPKGAVLHQNSCGHGYAPSGKFHLLDRFESTTKYEGSPSKLYGSLMGASPSEMQYRGYYDRHKRWAST